SSSVGVAVVRVGWVLGSSGPASLQAARPSASAAARRAPRPSDPPSCGPSHGNHVGRAVVSAGPSQRPPTPRLPAGETERSRARTSGAPLVLAGTARARRRRSSGQVGPAGPSVVRRLPGPASADVHPAVEVEDGAGDETGVGAGEVLGGGGDVVGVAGAAD